MTTAFCVGVGIGLIAWVVTLAFCRAAGSN